MKLLGVLPAHSFAFLRRIGFAFVAFALAGVGKIFGLQAFVALLDDPGGEFFLKLGFDLSQCGISGKVLELIGVGLDVLEFFARAIEEPFHAVGELVVLLGVSFP